MVARRLIVTVLALSAASCGGGAEEGPAAGGDESFHEVIATAAPAPAAATLGAGFEWDDPEPPEAQALAEAVLHEAWNGDKTTQLRMTITTLVDRTTGIQGFATSLAARESSLEDRLSRLGAKVTETEVTIRLPGSVLFDFDSAEVRADAEQTLTEVAGLLAAYGERPLRVEGHTDSIASEEYNLELSRRRAESVARWLTEHGIAPGRLSSAGHGESKPVADNATPSGRQQNRRVEIVIAKAG